MVTLKAYPHRVYVGGPQCQPGVALCPWGVKGNRHNDAERRPCVGGHEILALAHF
jgi:hypothetical protein